MITREWQGAQLPWFYMLSRTGGPGLVTAWLMEYHHDFLAKWHPDASGTPIGMTREAVLRRYKAVLPNALSDPMMEDVAGLTVAGSAQECAALDQWMRNMDPNFSLMCV